MTAPTQPDAENTPSGSTGPWSALRAPLVLLAAASAWPFVNFIHANVRLLSAVDVAVTGVAFALVLAPCVLVVLVARGVGPRRLADILAAGLAGFVLVFLNYRPIVDALHAMAGALTQSFSVNYLYLATAGAAFLVGGWAGTGQRGRTVLTTFVWAACLSAITGLGMALLSPSAPPQKAMSSGTTTKAAGGSSAGYRDGLWHGAGPSFASLPAGRAGRNVYYIILDEYARTDQLKKVTGYDNTAAMEALRAKGFVVKEKALANYPTTFLSLGASLGMNYPVGNGDEAHLENFMAALQGDNAATRAFKGLGYKYLHLPSNQWGGSQCGDEVDFCLVQSGSPIFRKLETAWETINLLIQMTPISYVMRINLIGAGYNPRLVDDIESYWNEAKTRQPFFLFAHTLPPHAPYIFKADCSYQDRLSFDLQRNGANVRALYVDNLRCATKRLLKFIEFLDQHDPESLVIVQSDHGSKFNVQFDWKDPADFEQRFGVLLAVRAPEACQEWLYDGLSPVNILRFALSCVTGTTPSYVEDRHHLIFFGPAHKYFMVGKAVER